jgi:hypothetical protein
VPVGVLLRRPLPAQGGLVSRHPALQGSFPDGHGGSSDVDGLMAATADHQGRAPSRGPEVPPCWPLAAAWRVEVGELTDMVHLKRSPGCADFTALGEAPVEQRVAPGAGHDRGEIGEDGRALPSERESADAGDPRLPPPLALDGDLQARGRPLRRLDRRLVRSSPLHDRRAGLTGQRLQP